MMSIPDVNKQGPRVYADTSVFGGVFDEEFSRASLSFFEGVRIGMFHLVVSEVVQREIRGAPEEVQASWHSMLPLAELVNVNEEGINLQRAYLVANILTPSSSEDALHVA